MVSTCVRWFTWVSLDGWMGHAMDGAAREAASVIVRFTSRVRQLARWIDRSRGRVKRERRNRMAGCYFLSSFVERRALPLLLLFVLSNATPSRRLCSPLLRPVLSLLCDRRCWSLRWVVGGNGSSVGERSVMAGKGCST